MQLESLELYPNNNYIGHCAYVPGVDITPSTFSTNIKPELITSSTSEPQAKSTQTSRQTQTLDQKPPTRKQPRNRTHLRAKIMFSSDIFVVVMVVAAVSVQAVPIILSTNYTGVAPYQNTTNADSPHYVHPGTSIPLVGLDQERTNTSSAVDDDYVKYHDRLPTGVIAILVVGSIVLCGGLAWFVHHTYIESA